MANPLIGKAAAAGASAGAGWATRKALGTGWRKTTGHEPPARDERDVPLTRVLVWAVLAASLAAVVDVLVHRAVAHYLDAGDPDRVDAAAVRARG